MRRFIRSLALAAVVFLVALWLLAEAVFRFPTFFTGIGYPKEWAYVACRSEAAGKPVPGDTLYIGDSVGEQVIPFDGKSSLCSNGAVLVAGNFFLVEKAIRNRPQMKVVVYMCSPATLGNRFERARTCNNFLKPFLHYADGADLDGSIATAMARKPASYLYMLPPMKLAPLDELDLSDGRKGERETMSEFSMHWLPKLDSLCERHGKELLLVPPPQSEGALRRSQDWQRMRAQTALIGMQDRFEPYFRAMVYLPDSLLADDLHWEEEWIARNRDEVRKLILSKTADTAKTDDLP